MPQDACQSGPEVESTTHLHGLDGTTLAADGVNVMTTRHVTGGKGLTARIGRRGSASVELAIIMPTLVVILFGIIEIAALAKDTIALNHLAREGVRCAAVGATPTIISAHINASASGIDLNRLTTLHEYRTFNTATLTYSAWVALGSADGRNNAVAGDQIRVTLTYRHALVTGGLFPGMSADSNDGTMGIGATAAMCRE